MAEAKPGAVQALYKCKCMTAEAEVDVPFRREDETITDWMQNAFGVAIYLDHRRRSPLCRETAMECAKLPAPENAPFLGGKPRVD